LGIGVLAGASGRLGGAVAVIVTVLGVVVAFMDVRLSTMARSIALVALATGTAVGLFGFVQDVDTIVG
jgi:hypothetical protein